MSSALQATDEWATFSWEAPANRACVMVTRKNVITSLENVSSVVTTLSDVTARHAHRASTVRSRISVKFFIPKIPEH